MKFDDYKISETNNYPNQNVERKFKKKWKVGILDVFVLQTIICVAISCGIMISRIIALGL
ncbi:MAG: hypothetical protein RR993_00435 [Clostridia bacterium]